MNRTLDNFKITQGSKNQQMIIDEQTHRDVASIAASHFSASNCANLPQNHAPHQSAKVLNLVLILAPVLDLISQFRDDGGAPLSEGQGSKKGVLCLLRGTCVI